MTSIIIPCYNAALTLPLQIQSLAEQSDAPAFEVIVVDNGSTDGLSGVVEALAATVPFRLRLVEATEERGASYARNVGIAASAADLLMFCDADDAVSEHWVRHGWRCFQVSPVWSGSAILVDSGDFELPLAQVRQAMGDDLEWSAPVFEQEGLAFPVLMGGNFGATRSAMWKVGGFDQSLPAAGEDNDLAFRLRRAGFSIPVAKTVRIAYRGKWESSVRRKLTFRAARAHALVATRYDAWEVSPYPRALPEALRCIGSAARLLWRDGSSADWTGWSLRSASALGIVSGMVWYRYLRQVPRARVGAGLRGWQREDGVVES